MNNKGQTIFMSIILSLMFFMIGMLIINFFKPEITLARASNSLDCSNGSAISDGNKLMCLFVGATLPLYILGVLSVAGGIIASKFLT